MAKNCYQHHSQWKQSNSSSNIPGRAHISRIFTECESLWVWGWGWCGKFRAAMKCGNLRAVANVPLTTLSPDSNKNNSNNNNNR